MLVELINYNILILITRASSSFDFGVRIQLSIIDLKMFYMVLLQTPLMLKNIEITLFAFSSGEATYIKG
jgi:hypothetical protein